MKKNIKLNNLAQNAMKKKEMNHVRGGVRWIGKDCFQCGCACNGPSSTQDNGVANLDSGLFSPGDWSGFAVVCG